jgi:hypothetical protein
MWGHLLDQHWVLALGLGLGPEELQLSESWQGWWELDCPKICDERVIGILDVFQIRNEQVKIRKSPLGGFRCGQLKLDCL